MFRPDKDRLDYSKIITPPLDYEVIQAVGTTYSLDLETLLGIPLALGLEQSIGGAFSENGLHLLEALRRIASKMTVFCQSGKIAVPQEKREIFSLMENSIYQVLPKGDYSFHPKVWFIKYGSTNNIGDVFYKVIVLSRNLTFGRSWDVAVSLDGKLSEKEYEENKPASDFLFYLAGFTGDSERRKLIRNLAKELMFVDFNWSLNGFNDMSFHPLGIPGYFTDQSGLFDGTYHNLAVVSPFLSKTSIENLHKLKLMNGELMLVSRKNELYKLGRELSNKINCWHMKDCVIDGESMLDDSEAACKQDIHAKVYLKTKNSTSELWIGSANCSHKAFSGNVEFMVKFKTYTSKYNINNLKSDLFGEDEKSNPFESLNYNESINKEEENPFEKMADKYIKELCRIKGDAKVSKNEDNQELFSISLDFQKLPQVQSNARVEIYPLLSPSKVKTIEGHIIFEGMKLTQLGMFYGIKYSVEDELIKEAVIKINTIDIPEDRDSQIFKRIIKDKNGFMQYIAFLLGDDYLLTLLEEGKNGGKGYFKFSGYSYEKPILYEKMLKAASRYPERLGEIKKLMDFLARHDEEIVPEDFKKLYEVFNKTSQRVRRRKS